MLAYLARRLLWTPVLLLIVSLMVFILGVYGPGDPVEVRLGQNYTPEAAELSGRYRIDFMLMPISQMFEVFLDF